MQVIAKLRNLFILTLIAFSFTQISAQSPPGYRYVPILHHDTALASYGLADSELNELNQIAFRSLLVFRSGFVLFDDNVPGTIWEDGHVYTFPHGDGYESRGGWRQINNLSQVPGALQLPDGQHIHGFIGTTGGVTELGVLPKTDVPDPTFGPCVYAEATDINDRGVAVGVASEGDNFFLNKQAYPVVYEGGVATKIPHPDGLPDEETDYLFELYINDNGDISGTNTYGNSTSFFGNKSGLTSIAHPNDSVQMSEVNAMSETGYVVGLIRGNFIHPYTGALIANQRHSYISYQGGTMIDLQALDSANFVGWTTPNDVSSEGHVVATSAGGAGLLWWNTGSTWELYNLSDLIVENNVPPVAISGAISINEDGVILAQVTLSGIARPCLLVPTTVTDDICVNVANDLPDTNPGDGVCSTGELNYLGQDECSMRAAIMEANARPGLDTICFRVPNNDVIYPQSELPEITDSVFIDGLTQPGKHFVHINGSQAAGGDGLTLASSNSTIRGLMINQFSGSGIVFMSADSNLIENCYFGTDDTSDDLGNDEHGILIINSNGNRIGTPGALEKANRFSFNGISGVYVASGEQNRIFTNHFMFNDGLGIELAPEGTNINDDDDVDVGPNTLLNHPTIDSVSGGILYGTFDGEPNETVTIELYRSDSADASGYGEGNEPLLLTTNVSTDANGLGLISLALSGETLAPGQVFTLLAHDNDNTSEFSLAYPLKKIRIADYLDNPIANKKFAMYRIDGGPPSFPETFVDTITTDAQGIVDLYDYYQSNDLDGGAVIKLTNIMDSLETKKPNPTSLLPNSIEWHLDNAKFDSTSYAMGYDTLNMVSAQQTILMNHTLVLLNMVVSIEWEVETEYVDKLEAGFRKASNYLFDVTDGQMALGKVYIIDDREDWDRADLWVMAKNDLGAKAHKNGAWETGDLHMKVSRQSYGRNEWGPDSSYFYPLDPSQYKHIATMIHEVGHYYLNLGDEYKFISPDERCHPDTRYGFMDNFYELFSSSSSEMSQIVNYDFAFCDNTEHYRESGGKSCWQVVDELFTKDVNGIPLPIFRPNERNLASGAPYQYIGPNDDLSSLDYDIGAKLEITRDITFNLSSTRVVQVFNQSMQPTPYVYVELVKVLKAEPKRYQEQGKTSLLGAIKVLGAEDGDSLIISGKQQLIPTKNSSGPTVADYSWFSSRAVINSSDSLDVNVNEVVGSFPALCDASLDSNSVTLEITPENLFSEDPSVTVFTDSGAAAPQSLPNASGVYQAVLNDSVFNSGKFEIQAVDANTDTFFFPINYQMYDVADTLSPFEVFSNGQDLSIRIDTSIGTYSRVLVLSTQYPIMPGLLPSVSKQVSRAHALSVYPNSDFNADGRLSISYSDVLLNQDTTLYENELSIHIHKWNTVSHTWDRLSTEVDTSYGIATASISGQGIYAAFTTDINTDVVISNTNLLPTTYALSQNYPNPFNPETKIEFALPNRSEVKLMIHNILGQKVKTLVDTELPAGNHTVFWDGTDESGHKAASGVYLYRFEAGDFTETKKMVLLK